MDPLTTTNKGHGFFGLWWIVQDDTLHTYKYTNTYNIEFNQKAVGNIKLSLIKNEVLKYLTA